LLDLYVFSEQFCDQHCRIANRNFAVRSNVYRLSDGFVARGQRQKPGAGIKHEIEIARGRERAQPDFALSSQQLANYRGDNGARRLAGAVGIERPGDDHRKAETAEIAECHGIGADFAGGIGRLRLERMFFADGHESRRAIDFAGRGMNYPAYARFQRGLKDVQRAVDVGFDIT
jgi:hypothetical protein